MGEKGMNAVVVGLFDDPRHRFAISACRWIRGSPLRREMKQLMAAYQDQLKQMGFARLGAQPRAASASKGQRRLRGLEGLREVPRGFGQGMDAKRPRRGVCDAGKFRPAAELRPGVRQLPRRRLDPGKFFPYKGGYASKEETPHLKNVGCEDCHGPGGPHTTAEKGKDAELQKKMQQDRPHHEGGGGRSALGKGNCYTCHDGDNSPDFKFENLLSADRA